MADIQRIRTQFLADYDDGPIQFKAGDIFALAENYARSLPPERVKLLGTPTGSELPWGGAVTADSIADTLEAAPTTDPASLTRIQASVSGDRAKLNAAQQAQQTAGATTALLNAAKTALKDPDGGADIALGGDSGGSSTYVGLSDAATANLPGINIPLITELNSRMRVDVPKFNVFAGGAGNTSMTGIQNTAIGSYSFLANTSGAGNTGVGYQTLNKVTTGSFNVAIGRSALQDLTTGNSNIAIGYGALLGTTTGGTNVAIGFSALTANATGNNGCAIGFQSMQNNTTGQENTAVGAFSLQSNTTGGQNTALGYAAGLGTSTGYANVAIGFRCHRDSSTGFGTVAIGSQALFASTTSNENVAIGWMAMLEATTGSNNTVVGTRAAKSTTTGGNNVAVGQTALHDNVLGSGNTAIGHGALYGSVAATAGNNTAVGYATAQGTGNGTGNTILGANVGGIAPGTNNLVVLADGTGNRRFESPAPGIHKLGDTRTVSQLPAASGLAGYRAFVTDSTAPTFAATVVGGGSTPVPVYCDGAAWRVG